MAQAGGSIFSLLLTAHTGHACVLNVADALVPKGARFSRVPVNADGHILIPALQALCPGYTLIAVASANNETGIKQPLHEIARVVAQKSGGFSVMRRNLLARKRSMSVNWDAACLPFWDIKWAP